MGAAPFDAGGEKLARVRRISRIMRTLCGLAMAAIPCVLALLWVRFDVWIAADPTLLPFGPLPNPMPGASLLAGFAISLLPAGLTIFALEQLRRLFGRYAQGVIFAAGNSRHLRRFALSVIGLALLQPLTIALLSVALSWGNPPGQRMLTLSVGTPEVSMLFVGAVFLVIAWIMELGRELAEEQAQIV